MAPLSWKTGLLAAQLAFISTVHAVLPDGRPHANAMPVPALPRVSNPSVEPIISKDGTILPPYNTTYWFDQLIDHNRPSLGTFKQRYWHTYEFYEPGGPIILMTPGEANAAPYADGYLSNLTINGLVAQQENGAAIVLEHRFYGLSNPYPALTVKNFRVHTIQQAIDDLEYFAKNVKMPMPNGANLGPTQAPWIFIGGSYSGALTSWVMVNKPGLFWAGYSSSGVVQAITDFWRYFEPIREHMPANCSADVQAVIKHVDRVFTGKNKTAINELKDAFGMAGVSHLDDVVGALRNNLWSWQSLQPRSGPVTAFYSFCNALEVKDGVSAPASGWGVQHALAAWSGYWKNGYLASLCGDSSTEDCLGTYDADSPFYTNTDIDNVWRSWFWTVCNEVGYLQNSPPKGYPSLVSSLLKAPYDFRQCQLMYPGAFPPVFVPNTLRINTVYRGWNVKIDRIFFANGQRDPWRDATISAAGRNVPSTPSQPIILGENFHCSDLSARNALVNSNVAYIQAQALASFKTWLSTFKPAASGARLSGAIPEPIAGPDSTAAPSTVSPNPINAWIIGSGEF